MLQQTQVAAAVSHFERWLRLFPDVDSLAAAPVEKVLRAWAGLGYYARARNLHKAARVLAGRKHWPVSADEWKTLPGIGEYTAGALGSLAFDRPDPILDGNVTRVFSRVLGLAFLPGDGARQREAYWDLARLWADCGEPGEANEALMELGALVCVPRAPRCGACPLEKRCRARRLGMEDALPPLKRRKPTKEIPAVAVRATRAGRVLLETRPPGALLAGHRMFPLFLDKEAALWRQCFRGRFPGWTLRVVCEAGRIEHTIMSGRYRVRVFDAELHPEDTAGSGSALRGIRVASGRIGESLTTSLALKIWNAGKR